jgi:hypothetical protein
LGVGGNAMTFYDDNFGHWDDMDDPEMRDFYKHVQDTNVEKECQGCGRVVRIQPHYAYCDSCATKLERGMDVG